MSARCRFFARPGIIVGLSVVALFNAVSGSNAMQARDSVQVIAHRGASAYAPEHTFAAWDLALEMGADYIEQDLQMTADGVLVVVHDDDLDRTARPREAAGADDCSGPVIESSLARLRRCEVGSWFNELNPDRARPEFVDEPIPTLAEVLDRYAGHARFYIETKNPESAPGMEEALIALLREHELLPSSRDDRRVILQSFSPDSLLKLRELHPDLTLIQLVPGRETSASIVAELPRVVGYADGIGPRHDDVDASLIAAAHAHGLLVHPYTVNDAERMRQLVEIGADGMFTDMPDRLRALLAGKQPGGDR